MRATVAALAMSIALAGAATICQAQEESYSADPVAAFKYARQMMDLECAANNENDRHIVKTVIDGRAALSAWHCGHIRGEVGFVVPMGLTQEWTLTMGENSLLSYNVHLKADDLVMYLHISPESAANLVRMRDEPSGPEQ